MLSRISPPQIVLEDCSPVYAPCLPPQDLSFWTSCTLSSATPRLSKKRLTRYFFQKSSPYLFIIYSLQGAVIYILDVFCNSEVPANREKSAEVLSKMVTDKLVGPKVRICVTRFLPSIFLDAMKQSPEAAVRYNAGILLVNQMLIILSDWSACWTASTRTLS